MYFSILCTHCTFTDCAFQLDKGWLKNYAPLSQPIYACVEKCYYVQGNRLSWNFKIKRHQNMNQKTSTNWFFHGFKPTRKNLLKQMGLVIQPKMMKLQIFFTLFGLHLLLTHYKMTQNKMIINDHLETLYKMIFVNIPDEEKLQVETGKRQKPVVVLIWISTIKNY